MITQQQRIEANQRLWSLDWHPNGNILAAVGSARTIDLYSFNSQTSLSKLSTIETEHSKTIRCVKFSHAGDKIACTSFDSTASIWIYNSESEEYESLSILEGHENEVKSVSWREDDKKIATCSRDKNIWVWEFDPISYDYVCDAVLEGHTQDVKNVQWLSCLPNSLLSCSYDNTLKVWEGDDDDYSCKQTLAGHNSIVWSAVQVDSGKILFSLSEDCRIIQWNLNMESQKYEKKCIVEGVHWLPIYSGTLLAQRFLLTGAADNKIAAIEWQKLKEGHQPVTPQVAATVMHESDVNCVVSHPGKQLILASCSDDESLRLWTLNP